MRNPICLIRAMWRSLRHLAMVSGHRYTTENPTPENVHVLKCEDCGYRDVAWSWDKLVK